MPFPHPELLFPSEEEWKDRLAKFGERDDRARGPWRAREGRCRYFPAQVRLTWQTNGQPGANRGSRSTRATSAPFGGTKTRPKLEPEVRISGRCVCRRVQHGARAIQQPGLGRAA